MKAAGLAAGRGGSVEIWLQPDRRSGSTFLALYRPEKKLLFTLHQSLTDLEVQTEIRNDREAVTRAHFYVGEAFVPALRRKKPVIITVTSGARGTKVYLDGALAQVARRFWIPDDAFTGRLILGDSPRQPDSFRGQIRGLAIYDVELSGAQVFGHYYNWTQERTSGRE